MTYPTLKTQADELRKAKRYAEAVPLYEQLWGKYRPECNEWDGWGYAFCLKQQKEYKEALNICREVYKLKSDFEPIKSLYAWCIYYTEIVLQSIHDETRFFKAAEGILKLSKQDDQYAPYTQTVFKVLDYLNSKAILQTDKVLQWTAKLNFEILDDTSFSFTDHTGKTRELASKKEQYFMWRAKALYLKGLFEECISLCEKAFVSINSFHYDNQVWFERMIALSNNALNNTDLALKQLKSALRNRKEWFIQKEIAEIYFKQGNLEEALKYALDGALNIGESNKKLNLYKLLSDILVSTQQQEEAKKHIEFIYHIRKSQDWKIDSELQTLIHQYEIAPHKIVHLKDLERSLKQVWEQLKFSKQTKLIGTIKTILPNGKAGFIETNEKKSYYFRINHFLSRQKWCQAGQTVSFFLEEGFDAKKNQKTENAISIKPINS